MPRRGLYELLNIYPWDTGASLSILVQILAGLAATYLVALVSESCLHRFVGHASVRTRRFWARNPRLYAHLPRAYYRHAVVHHGLTFRKNHVTQFVSVEEKAAVDRIAERAADERIRAERYGLTVGLRAFVTYNLTVFPIVPVVVILAGPWATAGALPVLVVTPLLSMLIHPYIHREHEAATREAPAVVAFLLKTRYFQAVSRHHYLFTSTRTATSIYCWVGTSSWERTVRLVCRNWARSRPSGWAVEVRKRAERSPDPCHSRE